MSSSSAAESVEFLDRSVCDSFRIFEVKRLSPRRGAGKAWSLGDEGPETSAKDEGKETIS